MALDASADFEVLDLQFTENTPSGVVTAHLCLGGEHQSFLSDANSRLRLQSALQGAGDMWRIIPVDQTCTFLIMCPGKEVELFLAHFDGEVYLTPNEWKLSSLQWYVEKHKNGYTICCYSKGSWMYLSHACGSVFLQWAFLGVGEQWQFD